MFLLITSDSEGAVVPSVDDEAVHVQRDGRRLRLGRIVPGTVILQQDTTNKLSEAACMCEWEREKLSTSRFPHQFHSKNLLIHEGTQERRQKRSFYVIKHSAQIQIPIRPRFKIFNVVIGAPALWRRVMELCWLPAESEQVNTPSGRRACPGRWSPWAAPAGPSRPPGTAPGCAAWTWGSWPGSRADAAAGSRCARPAASGRRRRVRSPGGHAPPGCLSRPGTSRPHHRLRGRRKRERKRRMWWASQLWRRCSWKKQRR